MLHCTKLHWNHHYCSYESTVINVWFSATENQLFATKSFQHPFKICFFFTLCAIEVKLLIRTFPVAFYRCHWYYYFIYYVLYLFTLGIVLCSVLCIGNKTQTYHYYYKLMTTVTPVYQILIKFSYIMNVSQRIMN